MDSVMDCHPPDSPVHGIFPGKNIGVDCQTLLQGIFPTQGLNPDLSHYRQMLCHLSHQGSPKEEAWSPNHSFPLCWSTARSESPPNPWDGVTRHTAQLSHQDGPSQCAGSPVGDGSGFPRREGSGCLAGRNAEALHLQILWQGRCYSLKTPSRCLFWAWNKVWTMRRSQFKHRKLVDTHIFSSSVSVSAESSLEIKRMQIFIICLGFFWFYVLNFFIQIGWILKPWLKMC